MNRYLLPILGLILVWTPQVALSLEPAVKIVPWPQSVVLSDGQMDLSGSSRIVCSDPALAELGAILAEEIDEVSRLNLPVVSGSPAAGDLFLKLSSGPDWEDEAYTVSVSDLATVEAGNYNAVALGTVTLLQALEQNGSLVSIPHMTVTDHPDSEYRGFMVDVARRYHSIATLKEVVDMCRWYKIRFLQLHLSDDQALTFPSAAYPEVTAFGKHYSMTELRDLVDYADRHGVTLIPEIDVPAHSSCFTKSMPDLFASPVNGIVNFANPQVWAAFDTLIGEVCEVFQSAPYFHLGADEANIWSLSSDDEFKAAFNTYGVDGIEGLFNYFINHLNNTVKSHGKKTIVWEGFNYSKSGNSKMAADVSVMMFDNYKHPQNYLNAGHKVINASWFPLYVVFDAGLGAPQNSIFNWDKFQFGNYTDPMPRRPESVVWKYVSPTPHVPGAQMCSWEMPEYNEIPFVRFRMAPFADRIWNPGNTNDFEHFEGRYDHTDRLLDNILAQHQPPEAPVNVSASDGLYADKLRVGWKPGGNYPTQFALYRNTVNSTATAELIAGNLPRTANAYEDRAITPGQTYYYWVKARNQWGWSDFSQAGAGVTGSGNELPLAYEPFDYPAQTTLDGQNLGSGFIGPWSITSPNGKTLVVAEGLTYPGLPTDGGALRLEFDVDKPSLGLNRNFAGHAGQDMSIVWFSFLIKPEKVADGHCYFMLNNWYGGVGVGKKWGNGFGLSGLQRVKLQNGETYYAVARYDCRGGNDIARLWINPTLGSEPALDTADAYYAGGNIPLGNSINCSIQGYGRGIYVVDEFRVGSSWEEVTQFTGDTHEPPMAAASPLPANHSTDVSANTVLQWTPGRRALSHRVYFGSNAVLTEADFQGSQQDSSFTPAALAYNTTYYWRVDEVNASGTTPGATWSFTTGGMAALLHHWKFDETGGTTAADSVGDLNLNLNGATFVAGQIGGGLNTHYSRVTSAGKMGDVPANGYTIAFWAKAGDFPSNNRFNAVVGFYQSGYGLEIEADMSGDADLNVMTVERAGDNGLSKIYAIASAPSGLYEVPGSEFVHIVIASDGVVRSDAHPCRVWVNGEEQPLSGNTQLQLARWEADHELHLGWNTPWEPLTMDVTLDDLRLYDGMLTEREITQLYLSGFDRDRDGVADYRDNCIDKANSEQFDMDGDGIGDVCDVLADINNDSQIDISDFSLLAAQWAEGPCIAPDFCGATDFDHSRWVDIPDLTYLTDSWLGDF